MSAEEKERLAKELEQANLSMEAARSAYDVARKIAYAAADRLAVAVCPYAVGQDVMYCNERWVVTEVTRSNWRSDPYAIAGKKYKKDGTPGAITRKLYNHNLRPTEPKDYE